MHCRCRGMTGASCAASVDSLAVQARSAGGCKKVCAPPSWQASGGGLSCPRLEPRTGRYPAVESSAVTEDNLALDVRGSPGKTAVCMALTGKSQTTARQAAAAGEADSGAAGM